MPSTNPCGYVHPKNKPCRLCEAARRASPDPVYEPVYKTPEPPFVDRSDEVPEIKPFNQRKALTPAERQAKRRERLKADPKVWEAHLAAERLRKRRKRDG